MKQIGQGRPTLHEIGMCRVGRPGQRLGCETNGCELLGGGGADRVRWEYLVLKHDATTRVALSVSSRMIERPEVAA